MKKKIWTIATAIMAAMAISAGAYAAEAVTEADTDGEWETEIVEVPMVDYEDMTGAFDGVWMVLDEGYNLCLPKDWNLVEVDEESKAAGVTHLFGSDDGRVVGFTAMSADEMGAYDVYSLEEILNDEDDGFQNVQELYVNDVDVLTFDDEETDSSMAYFFSDDGSTIYGLTFSPASDEEFAPIAQDILFSLSLADMESLEALESSTESDVTFEGDTEGMSVEG